MQPPCWTKPAALTLLTSLLALTASAQQQQPLGFSSQEHSQGYKFEPLLHLPGISPYFDAVGFGLDHNQPLGCNVTAATYLIRHAAIYANDKDYEDFIEPFLEKLNNSRRAEWTGPLAVFRKWESPIDDPESQMEQITPAGLVAATKVGHHLLGLYPDLVPTTKKVFVDKKSRTQDTAKAFVKAFPQDVEVVQISEEKEFHATIPHKYCKAFTKKAGDAEFQQFVAHYTGPIISRLQPYAPVELTLDDIVGMQQLCGYESAIDGDVSTLCDIFTPTEWMAYEYAWDLKYHYMVGHGNKLSPYLGFPWLNVTKTLFTDLPPITSSPSDSADQQQRFFLSFTHREVPPFLATALSLFDSASETPDTLSTSSINFGRAWKMAELIPFLGHIGIEKMTCDATSGAAPKGETREFVRAVANTAPRPIPMCQDGPGASCEFGEFVRYVERGMEKYGDFHGVCGDDGLGGKTGEWEW